MTTAVTGCSPVIQSLSYLSLLSPSSSLRSQSILCQYIIWHEPIILENAAVFDHLCGHPDNVPGVVQTTVLTTFKLKAKSVQHSGQIATFNPIETGKEFSNVYPFHSILRERNAGENASEKEAFFNVPRTVCVCVCVCVCVKIERNTQLNLSSIFTTKIDIAYLTSQLPNKFAL